MHFGLKLIVPITVLFGAATADAAPLAQFVPGQTGAVEFSMPGGNVGCTFIKAGGTAVYKPRDGGPELSCDRVKPTYSRIEIGPKGAATVLAKVGDPSCCGATNILQYGQVWRGGPFVCKSETSGLTCTRDDGRGFVIGKRTISVR